MSTLNTANLASDDESDQDFVPTSPKARTTRKRQRTAKSKSKNQAEGSGSGGESSSGSGSDSEDESTELDSGEAKRLKMEADEAEAIRRKEAAKAAYKSLLEDDDRAASGVGASASGSHTTKSALEMVEISRPRQFAGETIYETVSLPRDHPDVVASLARARGYGEGPTANLVNEITSGEGGTAVKESSAPKALPSAAGVAPTSYADPIPAALTSPSTVASTSSSNSSSTPTARPTPTATSASTQPPGQPKPKPLPRRKPRQSLEAMSAALDKGKKMTTLEKSAMDWKSHTSADASIQSELEANRRGGGYLEKQQFLDRVGDRRTGAFEGARSGGGRR